MFSRKKFRKSFREKIIEKFSRKKYSKSLREKYSKSLREKILEIYLIFFGPILGPIGGPRVRLKNRGLDLKTNKNKYTQMGPNILGLSMGPKNRASQYGAFLTALYVTICWQYNPLAKPLSWFFLLWYSFSSPSPLMQYDIY